MDEGKGWINRDILLIALSAFFADLGYQGVFAALPIILVVYEGAPPYVYGVVIGVSFGLGSVLSYLGGRASDRVGRKKIAILGNSLIPLLSLSGIPSTAVASGTLFAGGWISRNFRSPARRAMLVEAAPQNSRAKAFGLLHALDVGGGFLSALAFTLLIAYGFKPSSIVLYTLVPIVASTLVLLFVKVGSKPKLGAEAERKNQQSSATSKADKRTFRALLLATAFFGLSSYSLGFPVLTTIREGGLTALSVASGAGAYAVYLGVSALAGYILGSTKIAPIKAVSVLGYALAATSSLAIGLTYHFRAPLPFMYASTAALGVATASAETFEPVLTSILVPSAKLSTGMGSLGAFRSLGLFISNVAMGAIFTFSVLGSYLYAFAAALAASLTLLYADRLNRKSSSASKPPQDI